VATRKRKKSKSVWVTLKIEEWTKLLQLYPGVTSLSTAAAAAIRARITFGEYLLLADQLIADQDPIFSQHYRRLQERVMKAKAEIEEASK